MTKGNISPILGTGPMKSTSVIRVLFCINNSLFAVDFL